MDNNGILHCHSEASVKDSCMKIKDLVSRAKEMGAPAIALTDHGVLTGIFEFMSECENAGIKAIPGIEAYFFPERGNEDTNIKAKKHHLILMAKNIEGYRAISKAATVAYELASDETPRMDYQVLREYFGPGSIGHGNVFATSACMSGILAQAVLGDEAIQHEIEKAKRVRDKYQPADKDYVSSLKEIEDRAKEIDELTNLRDDLTAKSKANLTGLTRAVKAAKDDEKHQAKLQRELDKAKKDKGKAIEKLAEIKAIIAKKKSSLTTFEKTVKARAQSVERWEEEDKRIKDIEASIKPEEERIEETKTIAKDFNKIFGKGNFFIELQYHGIQQERRSMPILAKIAKEIGIPVVAANDAHYAKKDNAYANELIRAMRFNQPITENKEEGYGELYLKSDEELKSALLEILEADIVNEAIKNVGKITKACNVVFDKSTHYPMFKGLENGETAATRLRRLAEEGIPQRYPEPGSFTQEHRDRMEYELSVIEKQGFNDFLCINEDVLRFTRDLATKNEYGFGYYVGPGRGSAAGSLVCYLTKITSIDPMKYGLMFERFLNPDRVTQPDIDTDFHTEYRADVANYIREKYGMKAVCSILTRGRLGAKKSIRSVARVTGIPISTADSICRVIPGAAKTFSALDSPEFAQAKEKLTQMRRESPVVHKLIEDAKLVEGTLVEYGTHAAGIIISDNDDITDYIPMMYNFKKGLWTAQCDMGETEDRAGLLKFDLLGLRNINIINDTLHMIYKNTGEKIDIENVEFKPAVFAQIFAKGRTNSVFQFESSGMKEMLRKYKPSVYEDLVLLNAAYRPGPIQYLDSISAVKANRQKAKYLVPEMKEVLGATFGYPIYQEQVMQIFNKIAGFSLGESDIIRRAMSKKKLEILTNKKTNYKGKFIAGLKEAGATEHEAEAFWQQLLEFANYAFNKSHAAAYALIAYYTAYLKYFYTPEYMCAVMAKVPERKSLSPLLAECRTMGIDIKQPDINMSDQHYVNNDKTIIFGFTNIAGVNSAGDEIVRDRAENGKYRSIKEIVARLCVPNNGNRVVVNKTAMEALVHSGALDAYCDGNRASLIGAIGELTELTKKLNEKQKELNEFQLQADNPSLTEKQKADLTKKIDGREKTINGYKQRIAAITFLSEPENVRTKLEKEKEILGCYVSGHPLDDYDEAIAASKAVSIYEAVDGKVTVCGIISNMQVRQRKKDGAELCFFTLSDKSDEVDVKCWTKEYSQFRELFDDDAVVELTGELVTEYDENDEGEDYVVERAISVADAKPLRLPNKQTVMVTVPSIFSWTDKVYDDVSRYADENGCTLVVYDTLFDEMRSASFKVSPDILSTKINGALVSKL